MENAKHTQGPWEVSSTNWEDCHAGIYAHDGNSYIAVVLDGPDAEDNTNLIAAAPDLLAACELLAQSVAYAADALDAPAQSTMRANLADALAAIAKAKGES